MRSPLWLSLLGISTTLGVGTADDSSVTVRIAARHESATDAAGVAQTDGREHGQAAQADARVERHGFGETQDLGARDVEEELYVRRQALKTTTFDGLDSDTDGGRRLSATTQEGMVGILVRPDGTLGREEVIDGGVMNNTEGVPAATREDPIMAVEVDTRGTVRPHLEDEASEEDVLSAPVSLKRPSSPGGTEVTPPVAKPGTLTEEIFIRSHVASVTPLPPAGPVLLAAWADPAVVVAPVANPAAPQDVASVQPAIPATVPVASGVPATVPVAPVPVAPLQPAIPATAPVAPGVAAPVAGALPAPVPLTATYAPTMAPLSAGVPPEVQPTEDPNRTVLLTLLVIVVVSLVGCIICTIVVVFLRAKKEGVQREGQQSDAFISGPERSPTGGADRPSFFSKPTSPEKGEQPASGTPQGQAQVLRAQHTPQQFQRMRAMTESMPLASQLLAKHGSLLQVDSQSAIHAAPRSGGDASAGAPAGSCNSVEGAPVYAQGVPVYRGPSLPRIPTQPDSDSSA